MSFENVSVREAREKQGQGYTYVDVRSIPEFEQGHPAGAVNVPLLHRDGRTGQMMVNREFLDVMRANFPSDAKLLIGCQVGGRSAQAAEALVLAGFKTSSNVLGGFGGPGIRMTGALRAEGWTQAALADRNRRARRAARYDDLHAKLAEAGARRRVIARAFHGWERRLASAATDRIVRPFEWGLEWIDPAPGRLRIRRHGSSSGRTPRSPTSGTYFYLPPCDDYALDGDRLTFPSAITTPHPENNVVHARFFPDPSPRGRRRAVLVLPQWNCRRNRARRAVPAAEPIQAVGAPAHACPTTSSDGPPSSVAPTTSSAPTSAGRRRCAGRRCSTRVAPSAWLAKQGYESIGILGTSLGSCLSMLTTAHEPLVRAAALNHISPYFGDVVW